MVSVEFFSVVTFEIEGEVAINFEYFTHVFEGDFIFFEEFLGDDIFLFFCEVKFIFFVGSEVEVCEFLVDSEFLNDRESQGCTTFFSFVLESTKSDFDGSQIALMKNDVFCVRIGATFVVRGKAFLTFEKGIDFSFVHISTGEEGIFFFVVLFLFALLALGISCFSDAFWLSFFEVMEVLSESGGAFCHHVFIEFCDGFFEGRAFVVFAVCFSVAFEASSLGDVEESPSHFVRGDGFF